MTADRADRIEAQITRLAEIVSSLERTMFLLGQDRELRQSLTQSGTRVPVSASAPRLANRHLKVVRTA